MRVYLKLCRTRKLDMLLSYEVSRKDSYIATSKDKKRMITHLELLDRYYDEGKR